MYQIIDQMSVLYQYLTSDHFPLSLCLRVPQSVVSVQASDDEYMGASLQKVDWGQLPVDIMSNYMHMTDTLLSDLVLPDDVVACSGGQCAMLTMIVPILKSENGDITSKSNYRPIALATVCSKIIEIFIVKQMSDYLWTTDNQFAYKTPVYVCFLDASKAFDCINHWKLFQILIERKCPAYILKVFWYQEQMLCVKWNGALSECFSGSNGIKQGGILSPKLFNIYVDVLSQKLNENLWDVHLMVQL